MCDQLSALATAPYGNADALTPNLDSLARGGARFANAYCNSPLCAPSRASMMTGLLPGEIPVNDNSEELPASVPTFAHHLRRGGYKTVLAGKMHFVGPDQLHGFEERLTTDIYPSDFIWTQPWATLGDPPRDPEAVTAGRYQADMVREAGPVASSAQLDYDEEVHARTLERLRRFSRRGPDAIHQPWFICASYSQPHDPYAPAQRYWDLYEDATIVMPEGGNREAATAWDHWVNAYHGVDLVRPSPDDVYRTRRGYYAMTTYIDEKLGELIEALHLLGFLEDTVVIFTSDHGDMLGERGMFFKRTFREWATRVPLIFSGPGVRAGHVASENVSLVDLYPTLLEVCGLQMPELDIRRTLAGSSLAPFLGGGYEPAVGRRRADRVLWRGRDPADSHARERPVQVRLYAP